MQGKFCLSRAICSERPYTLYIALWHDVTARLSLVHIPQSGRGGEASARWRLCGNCNKLLMLVQCLAHYTGQILMIVSLYHTLPKLRPLPREGASAPGHVASSSSSWWGAGDGGAHQQGLPSLCYGRPTLCSWRDDHKLPEGAGLLSPWHRSSGSWHEHYSAGQ